MTISDSSQLSEQLFGATSTPSILALAKIYGISDKSSIDLSSIKIELQKQAHSIRSGNLDELEEMLVMQSNLLNHLFGHLISKSLSIQSPQAMEQFMRLALKAQTQSRSTISTLADIKGAKNSSQVTNFIQNQNQAVNQKIDHNYADNDPVSSNELLDEDQP